MTTPIKLNLKVYQGSTHKEVLRWESGEKVYIPITLINNSAPIQITAPNHKLTNGWRVKITNVSGMTDINNTSTYYPVSVIDSDNIEINSINAIGFKTYTSGGVLEYNNPMNLTGYSARMQIRSKVSDDAVILELTSANNEIIIDDINNTITMVLSATQTAAFTFQTAVYSMELVNGVEVIPFLTGSISLVQEVTR